MKAHIDREGCIGCEVCEALCQQVFELLDDGKSGITPKYRKGDPSQEVDGDLNACVENAKESCPVSVISTA
jgi:ferredoxin